MAILKSVVDVNNGNTGWTRQDVLDALETAFANLGFNGGTTVDGVPTLISPPGNTFTNFQYCGGAAPIIDGNKVRRFYVTSNGTTSYNIQEEWLTTNYFVADTSNNSNYPDYVNYIGLGGNISHLLQTGDKIIWNPYNYASSILNFVGYTTGQTYYVIKITNDAIQLATTLENALAGNEVDLTSVTGSYNSYIMVRRLPSTAVGNPGDVGYVRGYDIVNPTIVIQNGDQVYFTADTSTSMTDFSLVSTKYGGVTATKELNATNYPSLVGYQLLPTFPSSATGYVFWECRGWYQTDTIDGYSYGYTSKTNATMKGEIKIVPGNSNNSYALQGFPDFPFWRYTVPASGARSALNLKISRYPYNYTERGKIYNIVITNSSTASGWNVGDAFTIPSSVLAYTEPQYTVGSIEVGINSKTTAQEVARTGVCNILTTNVGAGAKMYQKSNGGIPNTITFTNATGGIGYTAGTHISTTGGTGRGLAVTTTVTDGVIQTVTITNRYGDSTGKGYTIGDVITIPGGDGLATFIIATVYGHGHFAVLKSVNDATKTYGTTYYGFGLSANNYTMTIASGPNWNFYNKLGTSQFSYAGDNTYGSFDGDVGLDYQNNYNYIRVGTDTQGECTIQYASTSTPNAYPLTIRTYRAQGSSQDNNFAIIQFTQTINGFIQPYATFSLHKGPLFGANVWDLNHVWNGGITRYSGSGRGIAMTYQVATTHNYGYESTPDSSTSSYNLSREANYGYIRESMSWAFQPTTRYACNIDTNNIASGEYSGYNSQQDVVTYYRNSTYDGYSSKRVSASANYYKPMKGLPISNTLMPCPYYLPDDFAILQVATSPGLTQFRVGDTVQISPSERYEIIEAGYEQAQNGLDNIANNQSIGMLFMGRI